MEIYKIGYHASQTSCWIGRFNCYDQPGSTIMNSPLPDVKPDVESTVAPEGLKNINALMKALAKNE